MRARAHVHSLGMHVIRKGYRDLCFPRGPLPTPRVASGLSYCELTDSLVVLGGAKRMLMTRLTWPGTSNRVWIRTSTAMMTTGTMPTATLGMTTWKATKEILDKHLKHNRRPRCLSGWTPNHLPPFRLPLIRRTVATPSSLIMVCLPATFAFLVLLHTWCTFRLLESRIPDFRGIRGSGEMGERENGN